MRRLVIGFLAAGILAQTAWGVAARARHNLLTMTGPVPGTVMPEVVLQSIDDSKRVELSSLVRAAPQCALVLFVDTGCPICRRMRYGWAERLKAWRDSVGTDVAQIWVFSDDSIAVRDFADGYDLGDAKITAVMNGARAVQAYGIIGTPTSFIIDNRGIVRLGIAGNQLAPANVVRNVCQGGGM